MNDWRGTPITEGATVVYPSRQGSSVWMNEGVVAEIHQAHRRCWTCDGKGYLQWQDGKPRCTRCREGREYLNNPDGSPMLVVAVRGTRQQRWSRSSEPEPKQGKIAYPAIERLTVVS